jgi:hypothetical protein
MKKVSYIDDDAFFSFSVSEHYENSHMLTVEWHGKGVNHFPINADQLQKAHKIAYEFLDKRFPNREELLAAIDLQLNY